MEILSTERYAIARAISGLTVPALESFKKIFVEYWDGATDQLISNLADSLTQEYLSRVGLKLTCIWTANRVKTVYLETVDGRKWKGSAANLQELYPFEPLYSNESSLAQEMIELASLGPSDVAMQAPISSFFALISGMESSVALPSAPPSYFEPETVSVVVPADFPYCGDVITIASPVTGRTGVVTIPPGSLPGGQFLVQFG
jgi:hypothetical protein